MVFAATDMHTKTEELLEAAFSIGPVPRLYKESSDTELVSCSREQTEFELPSWVRCRIVASQ
jgi:hypothetical protein